MIPWQDFYSSYVNTYLERDINELISSDSITFMKFLTAVAARTGIIFLLQPYSANALNRAIRAPKIYFRDTGLACYLTRWLTADTLKVSAENEIDLVLEENGILYPVEIKMTGNPKASMASANTILDKVSEKKRGMGVILCLCEKKVYLRDNLLALPIEYV